MVETWYEIWYSLPGKKDQKLYGKCYENDLNRKIAELKETKRLHVGKIYTVKTIKTVINIEHIC